MIQHAAYRLDELLRVQYAFTVKTHGGIQRTDIAQIEDDYDLMRGAFRRPQLASILNGWQIGRESIRNADIDKLLLSHSLCSQIVLLIDTMPAVA